MTVVIEKLLEAGLAPSATFTLACPLRMPAPDNPTAREIEAILQGK